MESLLDIDICGSYTNEEAVQYLTKVISLMKNSVVISDSILRISQAYFDYDKETLDKVCDEFINQNVCDLWYYYFKILSKPIDLTNETLDLLLTIFINYSDHSKKLSIELNRANIPKLIIDVCLSDAWKNANIGLKMANDFLRKCVSVIHNISRDPENRIKYRLIDFKNLLVEFIKLDDKLAMVSLLTLSYLIGENDKVLLDRGSNIIGKLLKKIQFCIDKGTRAIDFSLMELLQGLRCLSTNDSLKWQLFIDGAPTILMDILQTEDRSNDEIDEALGTMEHLCFHKDIRDKLRNELKLIVQRFSQHENENVRKHCNGIRWKLNEEAKSFHRQNQKAMKDERKGDRYEFDVFVSYSHVNQSRVKQIVSRLKAKSIRAWIDEEQMGNGIERSTLEFMANGIERSRLFILAISPSYKASACCRDEAEYAHTLRKPILPVILEWKYKPDSWLGIIARTRFYYELSDKRTDGERVMGYLLRSIERRLEIDANEVGEQVDKSNDRSGRISGDCFELGGNIGNWEVEDVQQWLDRSNLSHLRDHLKSIDGSLLAMMGKMRIRAPEYFNKAIAKQFNMDIFDVMRFNEAFDQLV